MKKIKIKLASKKKYYSLSIGCLIFLFLGRVNASIGTLPTYVVNTPALSVTEMSVTKAYLALFGRAPDLDGLNFWSSSLGANATVARAVNVISDGVKLSYLSPVGVGNAEYVEYIYSYILGKSIEDDRGGVLYWTGQLDSGAFATRGDFVNSLLIAAENTQEVYSHDMFKNRMLAVESASRLQKSRNRALNYQDTQALVRRVTNTLVSYNDAMTDMNNLTNGIASPVLKWDQNYSSSSVLAGAVSLIGSNVKNHKYLVWYNRSGQMMLAHAFLPSNFSTGTNFPAVITVHGGGWRGGFIEKLQRYNTSLSESNAKYVVLAPVYRLSSYTYTSPSMQNDVDDFIQLVKSSASIFKINTAKIGLFGESSGGHIINLLGSKKNLGCISSLYPPSDLPNSASSLVPYVNYYVGTNASAQALVSPTSVLYPCGEPAQLLA
jgi:hypothetical protein